MEALKGSCGMTSRKDGQEGSIFWFSFPYRPDSVANDYINEHGTRDGTNEIVRTCSSFHTFGSMENSGDVTPSNFNKGESNSF